MKNKKSVIALISVIVIFVIIGVVTVNIVTDNDKLSSSEKKWINSSLNNVHNINVINNVNIFGNTGAGVFYEFLKDLELEYKLQLNPVTFNYGEVTSGVTLGAKTTLAENDQVFYKDHYVLVGKSSEIVPSYKEYAGKKIGVLASDLARITEALNNQNITLTTYQDKASLLNALKSDGTSEVEGEVVDTISYMIVPLTVYLDDILKNNYYIINHLSDVNFYYTISGDNGDFTNILKKYYRNWEKDNLDDYIKREEFNLFTLSLGISDTEVDAMRSITYNYGFVNNSPYEVIMSGNYGGIIAMYLYDFGKFSDIEFNYQKYKSLDKFKNAINNKKIDLYFNYYHLQDNYIDTDSKILVEYSIIANSKNNIVINSINSLIGKNVYVEENSFLATYLKTVKGVNVKTYEDEEELSKLNKKNVIIFIDKNIFDLYSSDKLSNYTERYTNYISDTYHFRAKTDTAFFKLFSRYVMTQDPKEMVYTGMYNHSLTVKAGSVFGTIAKYILISIAAVAIIFILVYHNSKRIKVAKKIKKENKLKFIDQLTSLKNRNYLNEYLASWNNNTIYPQTMIVIDLNNIQFINDTLGYEEGDKQIRAAANILIKTQLDNSDVMRTDGNEFLIYLVGFTQKQVTNYIHKLNKEFKKLPYEYGAEFGYSMINDSIKTIEDAILEATEEMKKQKKKESGE